MSIRQKIQQAFDAAIKSGPCTHTINRVTRPVNGGEWPAFKYGDAAFYVAWIVDEPNIYSPDMGEDWETYQPCHEPRLALRCRKSRRADGKRMGSGAVRRSCEPDAVDVDKLLKAISSRRSYYFRNPHKDLLRIKNIMSTTINWTRINRDTNGNSRYVCHFFNLVPDLKGGSLDGLYNIAVKRANKIGGRKFHNKQYGGGIVFQTTDTRSTERHIKELIEREAV